MYVTALCGHTTARLTTGSALRPSAVSLLQQAAALALNILLIRKCSGVAVLQQCLASTNVLACLAGLRMKNLDVGALQAVFEVLQQHYPERLGELWFLNAPFIFWGLWRVVSPFIQQATKDKIKFVTNKEKVELLRQHIPDQVQA